jgi:hypothetical protein
MKFNQSFLLSLSKPLDVASLHSALAKVIEAHPMLRARFSYEENREKWSQRILEDEKGSCEVFHQMGVVEQFSLPDIIGETQNAIDISNGPLIAAQLFDARMSDGQTSPTMLLVCSHLVVDLVSWRIILEDLESLLKEKPIQQLQQAEFTSFPVWINSIQALSDPMHTKRITPNKQNSHTSITTYWGIKQNISFDDLASFSFRLEKATTESIFGSSNKAYDTKPIELLLACLIHSFGSTFTDRTTPVIYNESHGRHTLSGGVDVSRTVGWFTSMFPISLSKSSSTSLLETTRQTKDAMRRIPDTEKLTFNSEPVEILFNYGGRYQQLESQDSLFRNLNVPDLELEEFDVDRRIQPFALFDVSVSVVEDELQWLFRYPRACCRLDELNIWFRECQLLLESLPQLLSTRSPEPTLADYPQLASYNKLDLLAFAIRKIDDLSNLDLIADIYPCTPLQQQMLNSHQADPRVYIVRSIWEFETGSGSRFDRTSFERAWNEVVSRHDILRTRFVAVNVDCRKQHFQILMKQTRPRISWIANGGVDALQALPSISVTETECAHQWEITQTPDGRTFGQIQICHALIDGVSVNILRQELSSSYFAKEDPKLTTPFKDMVLHLQNSAQQESIAYWTQHLSGAIPLYLGNTPLNVDTLHQREEFRIKTLDLDSDVAILNFCKKSSLTPSTVFHMAWALLLGKISSRKDVCFGSVLATRDQSLSNIDRLIGPYINFVPCRIQLDNAQPKQSTMKQVQQTLFQNLDHQSVSLNQINEAMQTEGYLFDSIVNFQGSTIQETTSPQPFRMRAVSARDPMEVS